MRAYVTTTGVIFGVIVAAHLWRGIAEGPRVTHDPWYVALTLLAAGLAAWAWRLLRVRRND